MGRRPAPSSAAWPLPIAAEIWHIKEPQKLPPVLSPEEVKHVLAMATSLKARAMLTLSYGCGLLRLQGATDFLSLDEA